MASLVVAGAGVPVCKHGNRSASSKCGTADVLELLGVAIEQSAAGVAACVREAGIGFCFAPMFHPAFRFAGPPRRELGVPTAFNLLGPMANPGRVERQLIGVADPRFAEPMVLALQRQALTVCLGGPRRRHGRAHDDRAVEGAGALTTARSPSSPSIRPSSGSLRRLPTTCGAEPPRRTRSRFAGCSPASWAPHRDIVVLNAGAGAGRGRHGGGHRGGHRTCDRRPIDAGHAQASLDALIRVSQAQEAAEAGH